MADRSVKSRKTFLEFEATPGVLPAGGADKRLQDISIDFAPKINKKRIKPRGNTFASTMQRGIEWTDIAASGDLGFVSILYILESLFGAATLTTEGTAVKKREYNLSGTPRTLAIDQGSAVRAQRVLNALFTGFSISANPNEATIQAPGIAKQITDDVTLAVSPADIILAQPNTVQAALYLASTYAGLGSVGASTPAAETRFMQFNLGIGTYYETVETMHPTNTSWNAILEGDNTTGDVGITLGADSVGWGYLTNIQNDTPFFGRYEVLGATIEGAFKYLFALDFKAQLKEHFQLTNVGPLDSLMFPCEIMEESGLIGVKAWSRTLVATL
jgi:hypothetical protein